MTVVARTKINCIIFRERGEVLYERRLLLKMKGKEYMICVRSAILYGSETWCLREREVELIRSEKAMI